MEEQHSAWSVLPTHLAIIMDGNGRWAQEKGLSRSAGHQAGAENVYTIVAECRRLGIQYLTLYAFSTENWNRPKEEIRELFRLLLLFLSRYVPLMREQKICLKVLGDLSALPLAERGALMQAIRATQANTGMTLNLAINYGGRTELVRAVQRMLADRLDPSLVTEETLARYLYTSGQPDPDLLIRTSGEQRLSNYLLFQAAYSELYFTPVYWPDFGIEQLHMALHDFAKRTRRFGRVAES